MSNLYLKMRNKVLDINNEKIINIGDVLVSLTYKQGDEIKTIYDVFIRDISNGYVNIDFDGHYTSINLILHTPLLYNLVFLITLT